MSVDVFPNGPNQTPREYLAINTKQRHCKTKKACFCGLGWVCIQIREHEGPLLSDGA